MVKVVAAAAAAVHQACNGTFLYAGTMGNMRTVRQLDSRN